MSFRRQHGKPSDIKQSMSHWSSSDIDEYNLIVIKSNNYRISSQTLAHRWISCIVRNDHIKHYQLHSFWTRAIQKCSLYAKYKRVTGQTYQVDLLMYCFQESLPDSLPPPVCFSPPVLTWNRTRLSGQHLLNMCPGNGPISYHIHFKGRSGIKVL